MNAVTKPSGLGWKFWLGFLLVVGLGIPLARLAVYKEVLPAMAQESAAPAAGPWDRYRPCPDGFDRVESGCVAREVERGLLGGCPAGYADHPRDPALCTLPRYSLQARR